MAVLAVVCAIPLGIADDSFLSAEHLAEVLAVTVGGILAVLAAKGRRSYEEALAKERAARRRVEFVARAGQLLEAPPEPEAMLREIVRMAVPDIAQLCIVDLVDDGALGATTAFARRPADGRAAARVAHALPARRRRLAPRGDRRPHRSRRTSRATSGLTACARSPSTTST